MTDTITAPVEADSNATESRELLIHPSQTALVGQVNRVLITTGATAWETAVEAGLPGVVIAGLQSPAEWTTEAGTPHAALDTLVSGPGTEVIIAFDTLQTVTSTWTAAEALAGYLTASGASKVRFATLPLPLELMLASKEDAARGTFLTGLMAAAGSIGRKPALAYEKGLLAAKAAADEKAALAAKLEADKAAGIVPAPPRDSIAPVVDPDVGATYNTAGGVRVNTLMNAAIFRTRTHRIYDDLKAAAAMYPAAPTLAHDLRIVVPTPGGLRPYTLKNVPDAMLEDPRQILNQLPGGSGIELDTDSSTGRVVGLAIRSHNADMVPEDDTLLRTGWKELDGTWGYLTPAGYLTANGMTERARSILSDSLSAIATVDVPVDAEREYAAAENTLGMWNELTATNLWSGPWGGIIHCVAGLGTKAVPAIFGLKGSGKSTVAEGTAAHLSPAYGPGGKAMGTADSSAANMGKMGIGLENSFLIVDDSRKREDSKRETIQEEGLERLVRVGYKGGSARFATSQYNAVLKTWGEGSPDLASPMIILVGEQMPAGGESGASTRERMWPCTIPEGVNIFASGNARCFEEMGRSSLPQEHMSYFIRWVAGEIQRLGMDGWTGQWAEFEDSLIANRAAVIAERGIVISPRVQEVAGVVETGVHVWAAYLRHIGFAPETIAALLAKVAAVTEAVMIDHGTINVQSNSEKAFEGILDALKASVAAGNSYIRAIGYTGAASAEYELARRTMLGAEVALRGSEGTFLALIPSEVLSTLRRTAPRYAGLSERDLYRAFQGKALTDGGGKLHKTATVGGQRIKALAIPTSLWPLPSELEAAETLPVAA